MILSISARAAVSQWTSLRPAEAVTPTHSPPHRPAALDLAPALVLSTICYLSRWLWQKKKKGGIVSIKLAAYAANQFARL